MLRFTRIVSCSPGLCDCLSEIVRMSATIELEGIGKSFPGVVALQDVHLILHPGRVHALLGENGAGKSTLINILGGSLSPDHGLIRMDGRTVRFVDALPKSNVGKILRKDLRGL